MKTTTEYIALLKKYMKNNASKYGIIRMGIFGSVARQEQNEKSDIDIDIEGELKGFFSLSCIKNDLEELLGCSVDILRLRNKMDAFLKQRIIKEGIYV